MNFQLVQSYGRGGEIAVNNREDQEIAILTLHPLQICMVYVNTLLVQKVLSEKEWLNKMQPEDFRGLTPLFYGRCNGAKDKSGGD
jgi:TnpA family transposase